MNFFFEDHTKNPYEKYLAFLEADDEEDQPVNMEVKPDGRLHDYQNDIDPDEVIEPDTVQNTDDIDVDGGDVNPDVEDNAPDTTAADDIGDIDTDGEDIEPDTGDENPDTETDPTDDGTEDTQPNETGTDDRATDDGNGDEIDVDGGEDDLTVDDDNAEKIVIKKDRAEYWLGVGAIPTDRAALLMIKAGVEGAEKYKPVFVPKEKAKKEETKAEETVAETSNEEATNTEETKAE